MKILKKIVPSVIVIISFYLNFIIYRNLNLSLFFRLMFLDFKAPTKFAVSILNLRLIVFFISLVIAIIFGNFKSSDGEGQINSLIIYRLGRNNFFFQEIKNTGRYLLNQFLLLAMTIVACFVCSGATIDLKVVPFLYLIRLSLLIFLIETSIQFLSLKLNWIFLQIISICLILFLVSFDQLFFINIITYSNNLQLELLNFFMTLILTITIILGEFRVLNQEKELI